jgi:uncharacterized hydrophobic protein (TIGR00341 family)
MLPAGKQETVLETLDDEGVDYVVVDETSGREYVAVVWFPLPTNAVEPVLDRLREVGIGEDAYTVIVDTNTVVSRRFEQLEEEYAESEESEDRIAREELTTRASELAPALPSYVIMTTVSAIIATAGLLLDSPSVVVGSMVIAPLIGPAMATAVGSVVNDPEMFKRGVRLQLLGALLAIGGAAVLALLLKTLHLVPPGLDITTLGEIQERLAPDFLSLAVALGAGVAGVVSLTTGVSSALVGVMIAVALMPPAATVGIGMAWGQPAVALGAGVLALVNWLSINVAALVVLWYRGYRPESFFREDDARVATLKRVGTLVAAIALLSLFLGGVSYTAFQTAQFEDDVRAEVEGSLGNADGLAVLQTNVERTSPLPFSSVREVVVTVRVEPGTDTTGLAARIDQEVDAAAGTDVRTNVRYEFGETA